MGARESAPTMTWGMPEEPEHPSDEHASDADDEGPWCDGPLDGDVGDEAESSNASASCCNSRALVTELSTSPNAPPYRGASSSGCCKKLADMSSREATHATAEVVL